MGLHTIFFLPNVYVCNKLYIGRYIQTYHVRTMCDISIHNQTHLGKLLPVRSLNEQRLSVGRYEGLVSTAM